MSSLGEQIAKAREAQQQKKVRNDEINRRVEQVSTLLMAMDKLQSYHIRDQADTLGWADAFFTAAAHVNELGFTAVFNEESDDSDWMRRAKEVYRAALRGDKPAVRAALTEINTAVDEYQLVSEIRLPFRRALAELWEKMRSADRGNTSSYHTTPEPALAVAPSSGETGARPPEVRRVSLADDEYTVLRALRDSHPRRLLVVEVAAATRIGEKSCKRVINDLIDRGLAERPSARKGATITAAGEAILAQSEPPTR